MKPTVGYAKMFKAGIYLLLQAEYRVGVLNNNSQLHSV